MSTLSIQEFFERVRLIHHKPHIAFVEGRWYYYYDGRTTNDAAYRAHLLTQRLNRARGLKDE